MYYDDLLAPIGVTDVASLLAVAAVEAPQMAFVAVVAVVALVTSFYAEQVASTGTSLDVLAELAVVVESIGVAATAHWYWVARISDTTPGSVFYISVGMLVGQSFGIDIVLGAIVYIGHY